MKKDDSISEELKKSNNYRTILIDLIAESRNGTQKINKPGYISTASKRLFPAKPSYGISEISSAIQIFSKLKIIEELEDNKIEVKEIASDYV